VVGVLNPHAPERRSLELTPTFFKQLRAGPVEAAQLPEVMTDAQGEFRRPASHPATEATGGQRKSSSC